MSSRFTWTSAFGKGSGWLLQKIVNGLALSKISPNTLTFIGLIINIVAAFFFGYARGENAHRMFLYAGLILIGAGLFDMVDGRVARQTNQVSVFGAFFDSVIDRYSDQFEQPPDSNIQALPTVAPEEIRRKVRLSPIALEWKCRGTVTVAAMVTYQGRARMAFIRELKVRGKCASLLSATALRAVLLSTFEPATKRNGKPTTTWMEVVVPFTRIATPKQRQNPK